MNVLTTKIDDFRKTRDGKYIQGSSHTSIVLNHEFRNMIVMEAVKKLRAHDFDVIVACGTSGLIVVPQVAEILKKHILVVRKPNEKCYSEFSTEGVSPHRYVILDDLICSGNTVKHIKRTIRNEYPYAKLIGIYCYLSKECAYKDDSDGSALCLRDLGAPLLNTCTART
jgi:adenine/guanine phosphoribosyltransferase-like PRPP-binding protein